MKKETIKKFVIALIIITTMLLLVACAAENPMTGQAHEETGRVYGFFSGLWDGVTAPFAFIINLLDGKNGSFYNVFNNGGWYNFGFLVGVTGFYKGAYEIYASGKREKENEKKKS